jgi:prepilin-type N-terminal cleavage/methylation domain-containing protein
MAKEKRSIKGFRAFIGRINALFNRQKIQNKSGFTLIEVLVVVLIIGILTSIALPQYQKAVMKTRLANVRQAAATYKALVEVYHSTYNEYPSSFDGLDGGALTNGQGVILSGNARECSVAKDMFCCVLKYVEGHQSPGISCGTADYAIGYRWMGDSIEYCVAKNDNSVATKICQEISQGSIPSNFPTPIGHQVGYTFYRL